MCFFAAPPESAKSFLCASVVAAAIFISEGVGDRAENLKGKHYLAIVDIYIFGYKSGLMRHIKSSVFFPVGLWWNVSGGMFPPNMKILNWKSDYASWHFSTGTFYVNVSSCTCYLIFKVGALRNPLEGLPPIVFRALPLNASTTKEKVPFLTSAHNWCLRGAVIKTNQRHTQPYTVFCFSQWPHPLSQCSTPPPHTHEQLFFQHVRVQVA